MSPSQVQGGPNGRSSLGRLRKAPSRETSPKSAARPEKQSPHSPGRAVSPPVRSQLTRQPAKVRVDTRRRSEGEKHCKNLENQTFNPQVRYELEKLWQKVDKLAEEVERERSEKEELRQENQQLQQRLEVLSRADAAREGASSVPVEEPTWYRNKSGTEEIRVSEVTPIVAPSPPKSLNAFRQVTAVRQEGSREMISALHSRSAPLRQSLVSPICTMSGHLTGHGLQAQPPIRAVPVPFNGPPLARHTLRPIAQWPGH